MFRKIAAPLIAWLLCCSLVQAETITTSGQQSGIPTGAAGGDLSGSYPSPTVAKVNGSAPGGACPSNQFVSSISSSAIPTCSQPSVATVLGQSRVPFVMPSSGSVGNNGALSGITAVAVIYPNAYVYMPAGAISSGSLAGWYYGVFSSTSAATLYNNVYTSGTPAIPGSPTAFSTTGPGAYTQTTVSLISSYQLTIAGNTIGLNGSVRTFKLGTYNSTAGNKIFRDSFGSTVFSGFTGTTTTQVGIIGGFSNRGATNVQVSFVENGTGIASSSAAFDTGAVDTTINQNYIVQVELATATDTLTLEGVLVELLPGVP